MIQRAGRVCAYPSAGEVVLLLPIPGDETGHSFFESHAGLVSQSFYGLVNISAGHADIPCLHRLAVKNGPFSNRSFDGIYHLLKRDRIASAQVVYFVSLRPIESGD